MKNELLPQKIGCMYGLAVGDALGAAVEFQEPGCFEPVTDYRGFGPHNLDPGEWTDDTSMALALADSIAHGWDLQDQLRRYVQWHQEGNYSVNGWCFDIGGTTKEALENFMAKGSPDAPCGDYASGNGSIMRLAPVVIKYCNDPELPKYLLESSITTHGSRLCKSACLLLGLFLRGLMRGGDRSECLDIVLRAAPLEAEILEAAQNHKGEGIKGSGYVVESLRASLWAFMTSNSFEEAVLKAVNLGDDADTTGAVCGQMAGAYWGIKGIPQHLIDGLAKKDVIDQYLQPILS